MQNNLMANRASQPRPALEAPVTAGDADEVFDTGPWIYRTDPSAQSHLGRYFVESADFAHDVRLYINGDFGTDADRRVYGEALARKLNGAGQRSVAPTQR